MATLQVGDATAGYAVEGSGVPLLMHDQLMHDHIPAVAGLHS